MFEVGVCERRAFAQLPALPHGCIFGSGRTDRQRCLYLHLIRCQGLFHRDGLVLHPHTQTDRDRDRECECDRDRTRQAVDNTLVLV